MPYEQGLPREHPPKRISPGILPQPHAALLLHTCAVGPEPSLQRQAPSLCCPAKTQLKPHDGREQCIGVRKLPRVAKAFSSLSKV